MALEVRIADAAGFCWGVERALRLTEEAAGLGGPVATLGPLIHNPGVTADLERRGVRVADDAALVQEGTLVIRSHGVEREVLEGLAERALTVVNATCSFVKSVQQKAARLHDDGYLVVIVGEPEHPEVRGIRSFAGEDSVVAQSPSDLPPTLPGRVGVVVQTTQSGERLARIAAALAPRVRELKLYNTICDATEKRQRAAVSLAAGVDMVVVVGGRNSGNTARLAELCAEVQPRTHHVESADEIDPAWLAGVQIVGVTAGASTPADQIQAVVTRLEELAP